MTRDRTLHLKIKCSLLSLKSIIFFPSDYSFMRMGQLLDRPHGLQRPGENQNLPQLNEHPIRSLHLHTPVLYIKAVITLHSNQSSAWIRTKAFTTTCTVVIADAGVYFSVHLLVSPKNLQSPQTTSIFFCTHHSFHPMSQGTVHPAFFTFSNYYQQYYEPYTVQ